MLMFTHTHVYIYIYARVLVRAIHKLNIGVSRKCRTDIVTEWK